MATHSTIFIDRYSIKNNYFVEKKGDFIDVKRVESISDINKIHFFLLGNRLETLYMPSAIIIVEGQCDHKYISRLMEIHYPDSNISVIPANGDSRIKEIFNLTKNLLGDIQKSPYKDRIFAVLDRIHGKGLTASLESMGLPKENIVVWNKNGIEYYYPDSVLQQIFNSNNEIVIENDVVKMNGLEYTKNDLVDLVVGKLTIETRLPDELKKEFMVLIEPHVSI